ncbi:formylglycine-generating enzyme family protein [Aliifodinibius sp. S!AR15-10]|uniref:formylglycine-generating enzyme family protein n=1 Tax=Aliifodinibius sp. S!AR15-10 TaxID=2950437 RepID=UPI002861762D|nr:formylglycine-generating enzyme family protein [Aliifodinibius sp. S!AR15-10]MDR8393931.1 formylglycine-generating enzyme family protein [Aliifodinibius sp. S!AR15-10]
MKYVTHLAPALLLFLFCGPVLAQTDGMVRIEQGTYMPFYSSSKDSVTVETFYLDKHPVTNGEFLGFVEANPKWRRSNIKSVFADKGYLKHWADDLDLGPNSDKIRDSPVTNISWFAARAYAKWRGKRLPTLDEWEYVASASKRKPLASRDKEFVQQILDWYSRPNPDTLPAVGQNTPNYHGIYDMHGLIWEWVQDFNTVFISGESRSDQGELKQFYCAAGSSAASDVDKENYAAFLRYAFRGSLEADFSVSNLGFRCAHDIE